MPQKSRKLCLLATTIFLIDFVLLNLTVSEYSTLRRDRLKDCKCSDNNVVPNWLLTYQH